MSVREEGFHYFSILDRSPSQMKMALVKFVTFAGDKQIAHSVIQLLESEVLPISSRFVSLPFEGKRYFLKFGIDKDRSYITAHPGDTPGSGPIKAAAETLDGLAALEPSE